MVSSAIDMELQELLDMLERVRREHSGDAEYQQLRSALPSDWPV